MWVLCNELRPQGFAGIPALEMEAVVSLCEVYDATMGDFEKVLLIERTMLPRLRGRQKQEGENARRSDKNLH